MGYIHLQHYNSSNKSVYYIFDIYLLLSWYNVRLYIVSIPYNVRNCTQDYNYCMYYLNQHNTVYRGRWVCVLLKAYIVRAHLLFCGYVIFCYCVCILHVSKVRAHSSIEISHHGMSSSLLGDCKSKLRSISHNFKE